MMRKLFLYPVLACVLLAADAAVDKAKKLQADKKYDEAISTLEPAQAKNPKSEELRKALVEAHLAKGDAFMYNDAVPPRVKYPTALKSYRQALALDKTNKKAQTNIATIEGIYKSMGRPVPQ